MSRGEGSAPIAADARVDDRVHTSDKVMRSVMTAAIAVAILWILFAAYGPLKELVDHGPVSSRAAERMAMERWRIRPDVIQAIADVVPSASTYHLALGSGVEPETGQAFLAWTENVLLPRRRTMVRSSADWVVSWGGAGARESLMLPSPALGGPPLLLWRRGAD